MRIPVLFLALLISSVLPAPAQVRPDRDAFEIEADSDLALAAVARGEILPLSALMPRLLAAFPGEVLDIEIDLDSNGDIEEYEFELLTPEGRLIEVDIDARTGDITEVSDETTEDDDD